jgi:fatty-acyl-CoA synthase
MSYRGLAERSRQYARWGHGHGPATHDVVALMMGNSAEYFATWLGLTRIGAIVALINTNLSGDASVYAISCVGPKAIIVGAEFAESTRRSGRGPALEHTYGYMAGWRTAFNA